jgi:hypothetical protein
MQIKIGTNSCMNRSLFIHNYHISTGFWQQVLMSPCESPFPQLALEIRNFMMGFVYGAGCAQPLGAPGLITCLCCLRFCSFILFIFVCIVVVISSSWVNLI